VKLFLTFFLAFYLASILTFRLAFFLAFKSRRAPQHPELAIWCPARTPQCRKKTGAMAASEGRKEGGVAHLLKSRGRHLAGREILGKYKCSTPTFWTTW